MARHDTHFITRRFESTPQEIPEIIGVIIDQHTIPNPPGKFLTMLLRGNR